MEKERIVIIIDDDQGHVDLMELALHQLDRSVDCICFFNAGEALKALHNLSELPELIFIDFNLPGRDGMQCLASLRKDDRYSQVPIALYATGISPIVKEALEDAGATCVFEKPSTLSDHRRILASILEEKHC